ncbi:F-box only protein 17 [Manis javanica]|nr:F-box only protein 17 [Manis javanica]
MKVADTLLSAAMGQPPERNWRAPAVTDCSPLLGPLQKRKSPFVQPVAQSQDPNLVLDSCLLAPLTPHQIQWARDQPRKQDQGKNAKQSWAVDRPADSSPAGSDLTAPQTSSDFTGCEVVQKGSHAARNKLEAANLCLLHCQTLVPQGNGQGVKQASGVSRLARRPDGIAEPPRHRGGPTASQSRVRKRILARTRHRAGHQDSGGRRWAPGNRGSGCPQTRPQPWTRCPRSCSCRRLQRLEVAHGGNGWVMEKNLLVPGAPSQTCFLTSFLWCFKRQLVDLVMERVWQELLDSAQIKIYVADWWGTREKCSCIYRLRVCLLDVYENEVVRFLASPNLALRWTERGRRQIVYMWMPTGPRSQRTG